MVAGQSAVPKGFRGITKNIGLKAVGDDFAAVVSEVPCRSAAVFTKSRFAGPSVVLSRESAALRTARGMVVLSNNANVATGRVGDDNAAEVRRRVAEIAGVAPDELIIGSTGVIGRPYPMDAIRANLDRLAWPFPDADYEQVARAIMTHDNRLKFFHTTVGDAVLVGIAKGNGMMEPNMATLLTFFFTDADIPAGELDDLFRRVVDRTFNALSLDTDTSTSDTAAIFANGLAGAVDPEEFERALYECALHLVRDIASDGVGATKLIQVEVTGARDDMQAKRIGKAVVNSPLVKASVELADPKWGWTFAAVGKLDEETDITSERVRIQFGDLVMHPDVPDDELLARAAKYLEGDEIVIRIDLGIDDGRFTVYGCD
ncbi:bifunctional ornithine acetyltransferase/N-acetylglutamate synthase [Rhodococcus sp. WMMA185]|uniref:bifunctional ornithine acetyltransferase/N-acetylglutamate synthase n=1 Tax=Rhodococcus sp. WMMA185 TaxID=679318 RepID=UPI000AADE3A7|nr:bifunctional ornithine acetyltransferase/N-acetylglutamate synthase [Rhodococcus sp. WMMA185]